MKYIPGLAGVPATESAISSIDGEKGILAYRGYSIEDLAQKSSFEEIALSVAGTPANPGMYFIVILCG